MTPRQVQFIAGLARGHTAREIAEQASLSRWTVTVDLRVASYEAGLALTHGPALVDYAYRTGILAGLTPEVRRWPVVLRPDLLELLRLLATVATVQEIADAQGVPYATVKSRIDRLHRALKAKNRAHAVAVAWQQGLLGGSDGRGAVAPSGRLNASVSAEPPPVDSTPGAMARAALSGPHTASGS